MCKDNFPSLLYIHRKKKKLFTAPNDLYIKKNNNSHFFLHNLEKSKKEIGSGIVARVPE